MLHRHNAGGLLRNAVQRLAFQKAVLSGEALRFLQNELAEAFTVLSVSILLLGAYVFYRLVRKAVDAESRRRVAKQNMLYSCIAHDLETPMTSVQGFAGALRDGKIKSEEQGEICDIIYRKTKHMNDLIHNRKNARRKGLLSLSDGRSESIR